MTVGIAYDEGVPGWYPGERQQDGKHNASRIESRRRCGARLTSGQSLSIAHRLLLSVPEVFFMARRRKYAEREIEDLACAQMPEIAFGLSFITRQARVQHGIIDIVGWQKHEQWNLAWDRPVAVEIKAQKVQERDIGQVLRYVADLESLLVKWAMKTIKRPGSYEFADDLFKPGACLVGPSFSPRAYVVASHAQIQMATYCERNGAIVFEKLTPFVWEECRAWHKHGPWHRELVRRQRNKMVALGIIELSDLMEPHTT